MARSAIHDAIADASPPDPSFVSCTGERGNPGMIALGDLVDRNAAICVGEVGSACWLRVV